ncbi:MAG: RNA pseudouridine synthase [Deltaproteobacteria bacterium]|nr:RNA pseudouridine synthase [Deltaproteobacteria bacterium]
MTKVPELARRIVYEGNGVLVVDKPAGLPATGRDPDDPDSLEHVLAKHLHRRVWAVHQLDTDTSGLIVFVARKSLVARWAARLKPPRAIKTYVAFCHGSPGFEERTIDLPIGALGRGRLGVIPGGKSAISVVRVRDRTRSHGLLEVELRTGRTHQIRIHLAHIGHPLVGERRYLEPPCDLLPRHALHAASIAFKDGEEPAALFAPLPRDLRELARRLGLDLGRCVRCGPGLSVKPHP